MEPNDLVKSVRSAFEIDPWINPQRDRVSIESMGGVIILSGEVAEISAKRRAYCVALEVSGVVGVDDRLTVTPSETMGDDEILLHLGKRLLNDSALAHYGVTTLNHKGEKDVLRELDGEAGHFLIHVEEGIVYLEGKVRSLCDRRLAEVLAWWIPGSRNVINDLKVSPPEEDNDDQLKEAIVLVLDVDPFVDHQQVTIVCRDGEVTLMGRVAVKEQIGLAGHDCWYVEGVKKVENKLELA